MEKKGFPKIFLTLPLITLWAINDIGIFKCRDRIKHSTANAESNFQFFSVDITITRIRRVSVYTYLRQWRLLFISSMNYYS